MRSPAHSLRSPRANCSSPAQRLAPRAPNRLSLPAGIEIVFSACVLFARASSCAISLNVRVEFSPEPTDTNRAKADNRYLVRPYTRGACALTSGFLPSCPVRFCQQLQPKRQTVVALVPSGLSGVYPARTPLYLHRGFFSGKTRQQNAARLKFSYDRELRAERLLDLRRKTCFLELRRKPLKIL